MAAATAAVPARREETRLQFLWLLESPSASQLTPCLPWVQRAVRYSKTLGIPHPLDKDLLDVVACQNVHGTNNSHR